MTIAIEDTAARLDAIEAMLVAQLPARHVKRTLKHFAEQDATELTAGIVTIVNAGEGDYKNQKGMIAREGTTRLVLVGHIKVDENTTSDAIETAELLFTKEIKAAINTGVPGISFTLDRIENSRQLEHPYGWFVAFLNAGPPRTGLY